jgi:TetR/AcrR family transcriptional regulator, cholesterol catabolism regulator
MGLERAFEKRPVPDCPLTSGKENMSTVSTARALEGPPAPDSRFDRRLAEILDFATDIFADKGYEGASMRDLSRLSGISLAGLYYYFESKEKLLYFIQHHTFTTILERLCERLAASDDPEERIRIFVHNHVGYAVVRPKAMRVLSHEDDVLKNGYGAELAAIKRDYYRICVGLVNDLAKAEGLNAVRSQVTASAGVSTRTAVMGLFGMMNWLYTWYSPRVDPDASTLARDISDVFLQGIRGGCMVSGKSQPNDNRTPRAHQAVKGSDAEASPRNGRPSRLKSKNRK